MGFTGPQGPPGAVLYVDGGIVLNQVTEARPVMVGYTAFTSNGAIGNRTIANSRCNTEYPGTHLCTTTEFRTSRSLLAPPGSGAWLDTSNSATLNDPDFSAPCNNWSFATGGTYTAFYALPNGVTSNAVSGTPNCSTVMTLACCTSPSYVRHRGYTAFTSNGAIGNRVVANARCNTEFPGSHLCSTTEFRLSRSLLAVPGIGAWLDTSYSSTSTDPDFSAPCNN
jgi:hypothetical protein